MTKTLKAIERRCNQQIALVYWKRWSYREKAEELQRLLKEQRALQRAIRELDNAAR